MWTNICLTIRPVWSTAQWVLSATWVEDNGLDPQTYTIGGDVDVVPYTSPEQMLQEIVGGVQELAHTRQHRQPVDGT